MVEKNITRHVCYKPVYSHQLRGNGSVSQRTLLVIFCLFVLNHTNASESVPAVASEKQLGSLQHHQRRQAEARRMF